MPPLSKEYLTSLCEIKNIDGELMATGYIREIGQDTLTIGSKYGSLPSLPFGMELFIKVYNSEKGQQVLKGTSFTCSSDFLRIADVMNIHTQERRQGFRVSTKATAELFLPLPSNLQAEEMKAAEQAFDQAMGSDRDRLFARAMDPMAKKQQMILAKYRLDIPYIVKMKDISLGGMMFYFPTPYEQYHLGIKQPELRLDYGQRLLTRVKLTKGSYYLECIIRRVVVNQKEIRCYGVQFIDPSDAQTSALCAYVFDLQRKQLSARRGE